MNKDNTTKQLTELSDEELKQVNGGTSNDCRLPEYMMRCKGFTTESKLDKMIETTNVI